MQFKKITTVDIKAAVKKNLERLYIYVYIIFLSHTIYQYFYLVATDDAGVEVLLALRK